MTDNMRIVSDDMNTVVECIRRTADVLEERGLYKEWFYDEHSDAPVSERSVCLLGAMNVVFHGHPKETFTGDDHPVRIGGSWTESLRIKRRMEHEIARRLGFANELFDPDRHTRSVYNVVMWASDPEMTTDQVVSSLRSIAGSVAGE